MCVPSSRAPALHESCQASKYQLVRRSTVRTTADTVMVLKYQRQRVALGPWGYRLLETLGTHEPHAHPRTCRRFARSAIRVCRADSHYATRGILLHPQNHPRKVHPGPRLRIFAQYPTKKCTTTPSCFMATPQEYLSLSCRLRDRPSPTGAGARQSEAIFGSVPGGWRGERGGERGYAVCPVQTV
jgi:hypothetical protein